MKIYTIYKSNSISLVGGTISLRNNEKFVVGKEYNIVKNDYNKLFISSNISVEDDNVKLQNSNITIYLKEGKPINDII